MLKGPTIPQSRLGPPVERLEKEYPFFCIRFCQGKPPPKKGKRAPPGDLGKEREKRLWANCKLNCLNLGLLPPGLKHLWAQARVLWAGEVCKKRIQQGIGVLRLKPAIEMPIKGQRENRTFSLPNQWSTSWCVIFSGCPFECVLKEHEEEKQHFGGSRF